LLIAGVPLDHAALHRRIEAMGAVVVAEDTPWGTRAPGRDIDAETDPFQAVCAKYFDDVPSPRSSAAAGRTWFERRIVEDIDGAVFVLPDDDSVFGWDYPAQRQLLDTHGTPHVRLRGTGSNFNDAEDMARVAALISRAALRAGASRG
jgi:benzoyl-CoA reductase/2-hydroxyglutaryl-CoA dehydratase subunit BcrC/BadD/HgdB